MKIEHFAMNVKDPVAMAEWYTRNLAMRVVRTGGPPNNMTFLADESNHVMIEIYCNTSAPIPDYFTMDPLVEHLAFVATGDIKATIAALLAAGATLYSDVSVTAAGDELAMIRDPWGFAIQLARRQKQMI